MKTLYALSGSLIIILVLAAFNPDTVVDAYEVAKIRLVEMPRAIEQMKQKVEAAEDGDIHATYDIAWYHLSSEKWHIPGYYPDVLGHKNPERGLEMMRAAAAGGHAEALYMLSHRNGYDEDLFVEALNAGSNRAIGETWAKLTDDVCDAGAYRHMQIVMDHAGDPDYPWNGISTWLDEQDARRVLEYRRTWWSDMTSNLVKVDSMRAEKCAAS